MAQTKAQKVAEQAMRNRDQKSRKILQQVAKESDLTFQQLLDSIESGNAIITVLSNPEYVHPDWVE